MKSVIFYHPDFATRGYPTLKHRVAPGFAALQRQFPPGAVDYCVPYITPRLEALLASTHTEEHIAAVQRAAFHDIALLGAAAAVQAAEDLARGNHRFAFAFNGTAGHHAGRNYCWGFCYYNDAAMAVLHLREIGVKKIMIIDIDPHSGDGTRDILGLDPEVIHINFFADENHNYQDEKKNNYGCRLEHAGDHQFLEAVRKYLERPWDFEFVIVVFGHDGHSCDYGDFYLSTSAYLEFSRQIIELAGSRPILYVLSGGSVPQIAEEVIPAVVRVFAG